MVSMHLLLSMFFPCHYKCALMHTLQAMMICDVIMVLVAIFMFKTTSTSDALLVPFCVLTVIAAGILRALFNQLTFSYRFNDREQRKKFKRKFVIAQRKAKKAKKAAALSVSNEFGKAVDSQAVQESPTKSMTSATAVGAVATAEGMQVGLDALDVIVIDEEELQNEPSPQGKVVKLTTSDGDDLGPVTDDEGSSEHKDSAEDDAAQVEDDLAFIGLFRPSESPVETALKPEDASPELPGSAMPAFAITSPDDKERMPPRDRRATAAPEGFADVELDKDEAAFEDVPVTVMVEEVTKEVETAPKEAVDGDDAALSFADLHRKSLDMSGDHDSDDEASSGDDSAVAAALGKQRAGIDDGSDIETYSEDEELQVYDEENLLFLYGDALAPAAPRSQSSRPAFPIPGAEFAASDDENRDKKPKEKKKKNKKAMKEMPDMDVDKSPPKAAAVAPKVAPPAPVVTVAKKIVQPPIVVISSPPPPQIVIQDASPVNKPPKQPKKEEKKEKSFPIPVEQPAAPKQAAPSPAVTGAKGSDTSAPMTFLSAYAYKPIQPAPRPVAVEEKKPKPDDEDEEEKQWTPIIAFNIRTTTFTLLIIAACVTGAWDYVNRLKDVGSTCDWYPLLTAFTIGGYMFVAEPIFVLLVYIHRLLDSDEYDEFFSELHPYTGDLRDHGPLMIEA